MYFIIKVFATIASLRVLFSLSHSLSEYLSYLLDAKKSYAVLSLAFSALKWVHDIIPHGPLGNPADTALSRNTIESSKRLFASPIRKKVPVTPAMVYRICLAFARGDINLKDLRSAFISIVCIRFSWPL